MSNSASEGKTDEKEKNKGGRGRREEEKRPYHLSAKGQQKYQLEKLMAEPDKLVEVPDMKPDWKPPEPPEFKRFYMGSSAGAGSEVFHVYRHLRRYESIRQDWIRETAEKEDKDAEFQMRLTEKRTAAEQKTAKKRAKRLKKKQSKEKKILLDKKKTEKPPVGGDIVEQYKRDESESESESDDGGGGDDAYENPFVIGGK